MLLMVLKVLMMLKLTNFFNSELYLKNIECAMKNKLIDILTLLNGFKFVTTFKLKSRNKYQWKWHW